ncbi:uncharacterized protein [Mytilus edulis]|uniref:uncharacterized protein n=1 Tax=Mytilus edulis TaxID=6550 RepID=UPI0039F0E125
MSHRDQRSSHFTDRHQIFQDDDSDENVPSSEFSYFRVNTDVIIDIPSFPDEGIRTDNDYGIYNSSKATTSLCSSSDQEESEGEERAASFDYFPSATKVTPMYHNEYDEAYDVESNEASQNNIESPRSDKPGNKESDQDFYPGTEMETFRTYSRGQDDLETSEDSDDEVKFAPLRTLYSERRFRNYYTPMTQESTEEYGEMTPSTFSFDKSRKALKDNSASSLRRVDDHIHFPLSSPTPSRYSNFTRYDKSKSTGVHVEKSVYSRHHDDMFSGEKDPPFGHGKDHVDKVGKSICSLLTNSCSSVDDMPEGRPIAQSLDLADDGRRKKKKKKKKTKKKKSRSKDGKIPVEIRNMDQHSIDIYLRALKSGSEKRRDINLVIVGKKGAGKTSLVHRLFGEDFANLESTNGIEIHRRQCKIKSDEWTRIGEKDKDKESDINNRIMESVVQQFYINSKDQSTSESLHGMIERQHEYQNIPTSFEKEEILYERIKKKKDVVYERVEEKDDVVTVEVGINTTERDSPVHVLVKEPHQPPSLEWDDSQKTPKQIASEELSALFKSGVVLNDKAEDYTTLTLWDFAGDEEFYATHQTFLNPDAVYLLVANLNDKDNDNENHKHATFKFWMDTIHCYGCRADKRKVDPIKQDTLLNPPVIFVGTHTDELQDQRECSKQLTSHMDKLCKDTSLHLRKCHQISNKSDGNDEFQKIREDIFASANNSKTAEKEYPVKFIQLERVLHSEYTSEKPVRILSFNKVKELASKMSISITDEDELNLFLRYQNEIGNLLYFNDMPEYIILDPQWLADALKCIVTATKFQEKLPYFIEWKEVKETGKIKLKLIEAIFNSQQTYNKDHQSHLIALMEKFDIIINPVEQANRDPLDKSLFFYIPCMMQVNKIEEVDKLFEVEDDCKSMCLCFIFNFLPPYLISHLIVSCLRKYKIASAQQQEGLFKDCCVFDVSDCGCTKLLLVKYGSMIELQIWQWDKETPCQYKEIFNFVKGEMDRIIYTRYRMTTVSFEIKWKCCLTSYTCEYGFKDFGKIKDGKEFHCVEHKKKHKYKDDWFGETSTATGILNDQQHNFARLSMVVLDILGSVLYDRFDLDKNIGQILHSRDQYDISSLYQEHYKLRKHTPSKGRWGGGKIADDVLPSHTCIGDDIERIRLIRNEMQYSGTFALDDARYHILITIIQDMLNRFDHHNNPAGDSYVNRLKEIRKMELTPKDFEDMKAQIQKESSTPHQNFADKIEYHYHF